MKLLDTKTLILKCVNKDALAWSEFISQYSPLVHKAIRKRLQHHCFQFNSEDIKDLRQGFFIKLWQEKSLEKVKDSSNIKYWICMVAANFATDFYRRSRKDILKGAVSIFDDIVIKNKNNAITNFIKSNIPCPRKKIDKKHTEDLIDDILSRLSPRERIAVNLNIFHNKTHWEISKVLKLSRGHVGSILSRAKKKIKEKLQANG